MKLSSTECSTNSRNTNMFQFSTNLYFKYVEEKRRLEKINVTKRLMICNSGMPDPNH